MKPLHDEEEKFIALFPNIVTTIVSAPQYSNVPEISARIKELLEYTSSGGEKTRGLMTVHAYRTLEEQKNITDESMRLARLLGWCIELFQTSLVILDDMADNSTTRRGQICWYRRPGVGFLAVNDSLLLLTITFDLLKDHFGEKPCYPEILNIFKEALHHLCIGQYPVSHSNDYDQYTMENYKKISNYKRSYYTFKLPVYTSLLLAGRPYKDVFTGVEDILADIAILMSMQNDYMDCYGNEAVAGKAGNDIQQGVCSWLAVLALQRCSPAQRAEFTACYGSADEQHVQRIKRLYADLQLPAVGLEAQQDAYNDIVRRIKALPTDNIQLQILLHDFFEMVYNMKID